MFSKELYELDRNTVQYMIDEMQDTIDAQKDELSKQKSELSKREDELSKQKATLSAQQDRLDEQNRTIVELQKEQEQAHERALRSTINILRELHLPEDEIITRISNQYRIKEEQVRKCL